MKRLILLPLLLLVSLASYGQITVRGTVLDNDGISLPSVTVSIKGTTNGTVTDIDGKYTISAPENAVLVFSYLGFETQEIAVGAQTVIDVTLKPKEELLDEIVVVGYGTSTKKEFTGAVANIGGESIEKLNPTRIENALQGQIAGVNITASSGSPGGAQNIRIRGFSTNGDNNPLVVVDGVPYGTEGLSTLNPSDIESINVLKDATAGIYGVRAANGVIIITTKGGKRNSKPVFAFDAYYGVQETSNKIDLLNATEYAILKNEAAAANGSTPPFANTNLGAGTDWQNEVFSTAPIENYSLSVRGGTDKSNYSIGGSYFNQEGIVGGEKSRYSRYNGRLNFSTDLSDRVTFNNTLLYTHEKRKTLPENGISSVLFNALNISPIMSVRDSDGDFTYANGIGDVINPLAQIENTFNDARVNKLVGSLGLDYDINENFTASVRGGYSYAIVESKVFSPLAYYGAGKAQNTAINANLDRNQTEVLGQSIFVNNSVAESKTVYFNYNFEAFLNYDRSFGKHDIKGTVGASLLADMGDNTTGVGYNVPYNSYSFADLSATDPNDLLNNSSSFQYESRLASVFLRGEYMYDQKYSFSFILRRDGSTKFGENNRIGYFPTASAAWVLSDEDFFNVPFISFAKLRTSYGVSGNDKIGLFDYRGQLNGEGVYPFGDQLITGVALGKFANPDLKWEQTKQFNIGLDVDLFKDAVTLSIDYFVKNTDDLLFTPDVTGLLGSYGAGSSAPTINAGSIKNSGLEVMIGYEKSFDNGFKFTTNYNITTLRNEVTSLPSGVDFFEFGAFSVGGGTATRMQVGQPLGYFFGYQTNGVFQNDAEIAAAATQLGAQPGDLRYVDVNGDGNIDFSGDTDKTLIGSPIPNVTMGLNIGASYKGIDFSAFFYGSFGNDILRNYERQTPLANLLAYRIDRWTGEGSSSDPRLTTGSNRNGVLSDFYVEDGSYVRLKNLQLGYTLPSELSKKAGFDKCRLYVAANNLFTLTGYRGYDPDLGSASPVVAGVDYGFYPQARSYMFGMNLTF